MLFFYTYVASYTSHLDESILVISFLHVFLVVVFFGGRCQCACCQPKGWWSTNPLVKRGLLELVGLHAAYNMFNFVSPLVSKRFTIGLVSSKNATSWVSKLNLLEIECKVDLKLSPTSFNGS